MLQCIKIKQVCQTLSNYLHCLSKVNEHHDIWVQTSFYTEGQPIHSVSAFTIDDFALG